MTGCIMKPMTDTALRDQELAEHFGRRQGQSLFDPQEYGYRCPKGHGAHTITWSEFQQHIWCYNCKYDYPSKDCPIQRPSWMSRLHFKKFCESLPFAPKVIRGVDRTLEEFDKAIDQAIAERPRGEAL